MFINQEWFGRCRRRRRVHYTNRQVGSTPVHIHRICSIITNFSFCCTRLLVQYGSKLHQHHLFVRLRLFRQVISMAPTEVSAQKSHYNKQTLTITTKPDRLLPYCLVRCRRMLRGCRTLHSRLYHLQKHNGIYFRAIIITNCGIITYNTPILFVNFQNSSSPVVVAAVLHCGWVALVSGYPLVLWSRLHLVVAHKARCLRAALVLVIVTCPLLSTITIWMTFGLLYKHPESSLRGGNGVVEAFGGSLNGEDLRNGEQKGYGIIMSCTCEKCIN
jgi:hypothetical protein